MTDEKAIVILSQYIDKGTQPRGATFRAAVQRGILALRKSIDGKQTSVK